MRTIAARHWPALAGPDRLAPTGCPAATLRTGQAFPHSAEEDHRAGRVTPSWRLSADLGLGRRRLVWWSLRFPRASHWRGHDPLLRDRQP